MKISTDGLIIKEQNIGEQNRLVTVLTKSHGIIRAFVKKRAQYKKPQGFCNTAVVLFPAYYFYRPGYIYN